VNPFLFRWPGSYREAYDPSAAAGMPAHITLLYPFLAPSATDPAVLDRLHHCFAEFAPFDFALTETRRFRDPVLYLAVEPAEPFRRLTLAIWKTFPESPPYGGRYPTIVPHLTIADRPRRGLRLGEIARDFDRSSGGKLPIRSHPSVVTLLDTRAGCWQVRTRLALGSSM
jgi:2'-5' RNA ligase